MSVDATIGPLVPGPATPASDTRAGDAATHQRVKQMAQEFEAMLMTQMLREMRQSMLSDEDEEKGLGKDTMTDSLDIELGRVISRAGGFGLANSLTHALDQRLGIDRAAVPGSTAPVGLASVTVSRTSEPAAVAAPVPDGGPAAAPADSHDASGLQVPHGRVSSNFGWRHDPFTGAATFHQGIDLAQAYGQDVRAAAGGRIAFAGDQGSYGTTVVIEHAGGRQTRYAHLSAADVHPGDLVDPGQVIGKSGSSGRSTGPHLHFEVLEGGRPVDPAGA